MIYVHIVCNGTFNKILFLPSMFYNLTEIYFSFRPNKYPHHYKCIIYVYINYTYKYNIYNSQYIMVNNIFIGPYNMVYKIIIY